MSRYAIANWKLNLPPEGLAPYLRAMEPIAAGGRVIVAPPYPYVREVASRVQTAGQNCSEHASGAFTGEVAASMLKDCGATYVIIGHSERRTIFGETDEVLARKLKAAIDAGLTPVFCIGEDQVVRDAGGAAKHVTGQIRAVAASASAAHDIIVAYEPIWAIGTGRNATGSMVAEIVAVIRDALGRFWQGAGKNAPILYGGSVTPENIDDLGANGRIAGYLVGGASLDSRKFTAICAGLDRLEPA